MQNIKYIDCHSHPHDEKYLKENIDISGVVKKMREEGGATIAIGTDFELSRTALEFAKKHDNVWCTIGVHPADNHFDNFDEKFEKLFLEERARAEGAGQDSKIVGVGECGLDYFYFDKRFGADWKTENVSQEIKKKVDDEVERQKKLFVQHVEFSIKYQLPLVIHGRPSKNSMDAYRDILDILYTYVDAKNSSSSPLYPLFGGSDAARQRNFSHRLSGHAHFFVGNLEIAEKFLELGFLMSFDGPITFSNEYDKVIRFLPMEKIMIETDSPYAAPMPYRGQICYPIYVIEVAKKIADLKNISVEEVLEITKNNTIKLFNL
jgi:TatD DNase family protein